MIGKLGQSHAACATPILTKPGTPRPHVRLPLHRSPGASHFFTLCLAGRGQSLLTDDVVGLNQACADTLHTYPVRTDASVIQPDHLHAVWPLPEGDADFATCWRRIKTALSKGRAVSEFASQSKRNRGEKASGSGAIGTP